MNTPSGFSTVNSYIFANDAVSYLDFLKNALEGQELGRTIHDGKVANARMKIGESIVMVSQAHERFSATRSFLYLYVENADKTFKKAIENGAEAMMEPMDMPYGDRQGMFKDPEGNIWGPSTRFNDEMFNQ